MSIWPSFVFSAFFIFFVPPSPLPHHPHSLFSVPCVCVAGLVCVQLALPPQPGWAAAAMADNVFGFSPSPPDEPHGLESVPENVRLMSERPSCRQTRTQRETERKPKEREREAQAYIEKDRWTWKQTERKKDRDGQKGQAWKDTTRRDRERDREDSKSQETKGTLRFSLGSRRAART